MCHHIPVCWESNLVPGIQTFDPYSSNLMCKQFKPMSPRSCKPFMECSTIIASNNHFICNQEQCFFCVFSHVEIQTANHFLSPKFWLLWFFKERNLMKRRHIFWSLIREMGTMSDMICQISLISGEIEGHSPLKFGDGWLVEPKFLAPLWTQYQWITASWTKLTDFERNLALFRQNKKCWSGESWSRSSIL
jgi:hypothetical protein